MISLTDNTISGNGGTTLIREWKVWWKCPFGISPIREEIVDACIKHELDPEFNVSPIVVAIGDDGNYEPYLN